jgi:two-component system, OmpR family, sensor kinase
MLPERTARASIRWRFTVWVSVVMIASIGVTFAIVLSETTSRLRTQIDRDLKGETSQLAQSFDLLSAGPPAALASAARRYVTAQPLRSIGTVLFVIVPGQGLVSNRPELFGARRPDDGENSKQQVAENELATRLARPRLGFSTQTLADAGSVRMLERPVTVGGMRVTVGAGEPLGSVTRARHGVIQSFLLAGLFVVLAVVIGSYLVGTRVTAPLRRMARIAARVDAGDLEPRMDVPESRHDEIGVLATAFNRMLERLEEGFRSQRAFIADASHELRTPLTVIQGQLEVLALNPDPEAAEVRRVERLVAAEINRMRRLVDDLLLLAQAERMDFLAVDVIEVRRFLTQLWDGATLTADRRFELGEVPDGQLRADPDRLAQAVRNLINNAVNHTRLGDGTVRLEALEATPGELVIAISDDGPGIGPGELERIFERFHRSGYSRAAAIGGSGLGLAIVRAIIEAHGGTATASNGGLRGGARFELHLPGFRREAPGSANRDPGRSASVTN